MEHVNFDYAKKLTAVNAINLASLAWAPPPPKTVSIGGIVEPAAKLKWDKVESAQGYNIHWGIAPNKLYQSWQIYDTNTHFMRCLDRDTPYYFSIEAFNENGISEKSKIQFID